MKILEANTWLCDLQTVQSFVLFFSFLSHIVVDIDTASKDYCNCKTFHGSSLHQCNTVKHAAQGLKDVSVYVYLHTPQ